MKTFFGVGLHLVVVIVLIERQRSSRINSCDLNLVNNGSKLRFSRERIGHRSPPEVSTFNSTTGRVNVKAGLLPLH